MLFTNLPNITAAMTTTGITDSMINVSCTRTSRSLSELSPQLMNVPEAPTRYLPGNDKQHGYAANGRCQFAEDHRDIYSDGVLQDRAICRQTVHKFTCACEQASKR
jgi:hypothetical protein